MKSWLKYMPIIEGIEKVEEYRHCLRKEDFMKNAKCRCHRCWREKCRGKEDISYFKLLPGGCEMNFYPSWNDFSSGNDSDDSSNNPSKTDWRGIHRCRYCESKVEWAICRCDDEGFYIDDRGKERCTRCDEIGCEQSYCDMSD